MAKNSPRAGRSRTALISVLVVLAAIALIAWAAWPQPLVVDVARASRGDLSAWIEDQAMTRVPHVHRITMPIDGRIEPITLVEGDAVRRGQVIAMLETDEIDSAIAAAQARIARIDARRAETDDTRLELTALEQVSEFLVSLDRTVEAAEERTLAGAARRDFTSDVRQRAEAAYEAGAMTPTEVERARVEAVEAEVAYRTDILTFRAAIATRAAARILPRFIREYIDLRMHPRSVLEQDRREAEEELSRLQRDRQRAVITSPADGVVFSRVVADRTALAAGELLLLIGNLEDLEVEAEILSEEAVRITAGARAEIFGGAVGARPIPARVQQVYPQGFRRISALGIEEQRVLIILTFEPGELAVLAEQGRHLGADFRVRVRMLADARTDVLRAPRTAIFRGADGQWSAFVVRGGRAERTALDVGLITPSNVEIRSGIADGEQVILSPPGTLQHGARIRPVER